MTLSLDKRPCKIGTSVNTRTERHGDDDVPACDIPLEGIILDRDDVHLLLGKGTHSHLFTTKKNSGMDFQELSDFARKVSPLRYADKFEDSHVLLFLHGDDDGVELVCRIAKIKLEPRAGGVVAMSLTVQCTPESDQMARVFDHLNREISCEITFGKAAEKKSDKQRDLPIGAPADNGADAEAPTATH